MYDDEISQSKERLLLEDGKEFFTFFGGLTLGEK